ncbi:MAG: hypothetical protein HC835_18020 [Oscillatoriales cyanobacterium RM2_1_1]|nr:hypothetical protein [Oscillatoriales cyanobacterium SM2_3_0]NJO47353.1 hypothetical protein [Oscillatoriales cyanobacterium RM2_1_1]
MDFLDWLDTHFPTVWSAIAVAKCPHGLSAIDKLDWLRGFSSGRHHWFLSADESTYFRSGYASGSYLALWWDKTLFNVAQEMNK